MSFKIRIYGSNNFDLRVPSFNYNMTRLLSNKYNRICLHTDNLWINPNTCKLLLITVSRFGKSQFAFITLALHFHGRPNKRLITKTSQITHNT